MFQPYAGVKTSVLFLDKQLAKKNDEILFGKVENDGFDLGAQRRRIEKNDLPMAFEILRDWQRGKKTESKLALWVKKEKIAENGDYNLTVDRYREAVDYSKVKWPMVKLGEIADLIGGGTPSKTKKEFWENGDIRWISARHIDEDSKVVGFDLITEKALKNSSTKVVPKGEVIFVTRVSVGKITISDSIYAINQDLTGVLSNKKKAISKYLFHILRQKAEKIRAIAQGTGVKGITRKKFANISIPLPPLEVQEEIVAQIEKEQKMVEECKKLIAIHEQKIKNRIARYGVSDGKNYH